MKLWATNYFLPVVNNGDQASIPLKSSKEKTYSINGQIISLLEKEWCKAAMEGSVVIIIKDNKKVTFNYTGTGRRQARCRMYSRYPATGKTKFKIARSAYCH